MRRLGVWVGWAVLLVALGAAAAPAAPPRDEDDEDGPKASARPQDGWNPAITRLFGLGDKKPAPKPDKDKEPDKKRDAPAPRPSAQAEAAANLRRLEEAKLHRRQDVCLRLREIARETNDDDLERRAIQLDQRAWEVYLERTARLGGEPSDAERLTAPPSRAGNQGSAGSASVREVKP